jgi:hypothetical protein
MIQAIGIAAFFAGGFYLIFGRQPVKGRSSGKPPTTDMPV